MRSSPIHTAPSSTFVTGVADPDVDPKPHQRAPRRFAQVFGKCRKDRGSCFNQDDAGDRRIDGVEFQAQGLARDLAERARHLDTGRAAANQDERQEPSLIDGIRLALGLFERQQQSPPNRQRIVERFQSRRGIGPLVVPKIRMRCAGCDDQVVIGERLAACVARSRWRRA